ncbi:hypothetical protein WJ92_02950 [Burkholderia ubonensis]|nr:hypothetical protein WJ92_02950 [Burkholderia ubonensis]
MRWSAEINFIRILVAAKLAAAGLPNVYKCRYFGSSNRCNEQIKIKIISGCSRLNYNLSMLVYRYVHLLIFR